MRMRFQGPRMRFNDGLERPQQSDTTITPSDSFEEEWEEMEKRGAESRARREAVAMDPIGAIEAGWEELSRAERFAQAAQDKWSGEKRTQHVEDSNAVHDRKLSFAERFAAATRLKWNP